MKMPSLDEGLVGRRREKHRQSKPEQHIWKSTFEERIMKQFKGRVTDLNKPGNITEAITEANLLLNCLF